MIGTDERILELQAELQGELVKGLPPAPKLGTPEYDKLCEPLSEERKAEIREVHGDDYFAWLEAGKEHARKARAYYPQAKAEAAWIDQHFGRPPWMSLDNLTKEIAYDAGKVEVHVPPICGQCKFQIDGVCTNPRFEKPRRGYELAVPSVGSCQFFENDWHRINKEIPFLCFGLRDGKLFFVNDNSESFAVKATTGILARMLHAQGATAWSLNHIVGNCFFFDNSTPDFKCSAYQPHPEEFHRVAGPCIDEADAEELWSHFDWLGTWDPRDLIDYGNQGPRPQETH